MQIQEGTEKWIKRMIKVIQFCSTEEQQIILELKKGEITLLSIPQKKNVFDTSQYTLLNFFPQILQATFSRVVNLFFLAISLIMVIKPKELTPFAPWLVIGPLFFNIVVYTLKEWLLESMRRRSDNFINKQTTTRGSKLSSGLQENVLWEDIQIGDILYLRKGDIVPADIILLDSGQVRDREALCMVDTQFTDGKSTLTKKRSSYLTQLIVTRTRQKNSFQEYRKLLTGKLEYEPPHGNTQKFDGRLKLKKDPKIETLTIDNFIPKGSKIRQTSWVFGLVVYTGMDCKMMKCSKFNRVKKDVFWHQSNKVSYLLIFIVIFFALVSLVVLKSKTDDLMFMRKYDPNATSGLKFFNLCVLFSQLLPITLFLVQDISQLIGKFLCERAIINEFQNEFICVNDPNLLGELGHIDYILLDKTGTLTTSYQKLDCILYGNQQFTINHNTIFQAIAQNRKLTHQQLMGETENEYFINSEFDGMKIVSENQTTKALERKENYIHSLKVTQPKSNHQKFEREQRQPGQPQYVDFDFGQIQQNNPELLDFRLIPDQDETIKDKVVLSKQGSSSQRFSKRASRAFHTLIAVRATMKLSILRGIYSKGKQKFSNDRGDQDEEFLKLVKDYKNKQPQSQYEENGDEHSLIYDSFMKCLILCHEVRPVYSSEDIQYESFSKNEEVTLEFAKNCGYVMEKFNRYDQPDEYYCRIFDKSVKYKILGLNTYSDRRNVNSVVIQSPPTGNTIFLAGESDYTTLQQLSGNGSGQASLLICKGDYEAMRQLLDANQKEREELENMLIMHKKRGVRMIIYATKVLNEKETEEYSKRYNLLRSSLTSQEEQLELLAKEYENNLNILGILGFKEELKPDALGFVRSLTAANIYTWVLSGDSEACVISCSQALEIIQSDFKTLKIKSLSRDEIFTEISSALGILQQELQKSQIAKQVNSKTHTRIIHSKTKLQGDVYNRFNQFCISINGQSLEIIKNDKVLVSHFRFLCFVCRSVIGYNLTPQHKRYLCQSIQKHFPNSPTVLAVGDGYNDSLMMQEADIGIEVLNRGRKGRSFQPQVNGGDFIVSQLSQIQDLLFHKGKNQSERIFFVIYFLFRQSIIIGMTLFYYNWFCSFTSTSLHDSVALLLVTYLFTLPNILVHVTIDEPTNRYINLELPALYVDGHIRKQYFLSTFIVKSLLEGVLVSTGIFYATLFILVSSTDLQGKTSDLKLTSFVMIFSITLILNFQLLWSLLSRGIYWALCSSSISIAFFICWIFVNYPAQFSQWNYRTLVIQLFTRFDAIMSLLINLGIGYVVHELIAIFQLYWMPTLYQQTADINMEGQGWLDINNSEIIQQSIQLKMDISKIVKSVFNGVSYILPSIQELLNPGDTQVTEMKLNLITLTMKELIQEKKFKSLKLQQSLKHYRFYFLVLLIYFGAYFLSDWQLGNQNNYNPIEYLVAFVAILLVILLTFTRYFRQRYYQLSHLIVGFIVIIKIVIDWLSNEFEISLSAQLVTILATINKTNMPILPVFVYNFTYILQFIARIIFIAIFNTPIGKNSGQPQFYTSARRAVYSVTSIIILSVAIVILLLFAYYKAIKQRRNDYLARDQIEQDNNTAQDILSILVPKFVQQYISNGVYTMQEAQDDVAILFLYICEFDSIMKEEGKNVVPMLDSLFRVYDNLCLQHGVQKIETVGYTYMAASGIKACEIGISAHILKTEKTVRLINLAYDMSKQVVGRRYGKGNQIEIKVGIHVGRVIAGVIGHHKPQFSLIGDPVNQTSRVGSTGDAGAITLSEQAFNKAKAHVKYYIKKQKQAKGLGTINTYQVFQERPQNYMPSLVAQRFQNAFKAVRSEIKKQNFEPNSPQKSKNNLFQKLRQGKNIVQIEESKLGESILPSIMRNQLSPSALKFTSLKQQISAEQQQQKERERENEPVLATDEDDIFNIQEELKLQKEKKDILRPNKFVLTVPSEQEEVYEDFLNITKERNVKFAQYGILSLGFIYLIQTILVIIVRKLFESGTTIFLIRAFFLIGLIIIAPFIEQAYKQLHLKIIFWIVLLYGAEATLIQTYLANNSEVANISILELLFIILMSCNLGIFSFIGIVSYLCIVLICFIILFQQSDQISYYYVFYIVAAIILIIIQSYNRITENIQIFNNLQINEERKVKQLSLVSQLLPTHAFLKLRNTSIFNKQDLTDEFQEVTLLFADIKGFTEYSNTQKPEGVVNMLRNLFTEFDKMCLRFNVYKVYTIGDCYVVMGFTNSAKRNPIQEAINTVRMGMAMVDIIRDVRVKINFKALDMRIGIHTGSVIGGIIGTDIVRYDIYGKDVSIANKMESNGEEGHIMVSDVTKGIIDRGEEIPFNFQKIKDVELPKFGVTYGGWIVSENTLLKNDPLDERKLQSP